MLGGWWMDADIPIRNPEEFARLESGQYGQIFLATDNNSIHDDFFGSASSTPFLADFLLSLCRNCYLRGWLFIAHKTGPGMFNRATNRAIFNHRRDAPDGADAHGRSSGILGPHRGFRYAVQGGAAVLADGLIAP